jgi:hypothetical protein
MNEEEAHLEQLFLYIYFVMIFENKWLNPPLEVPPTVGCTGRWGLDPASVGHDGRIPGAVGHGGRATQAEPFLSAPPSLVTHSSKFSAFQPFGALVAEVCF